MAGSDKFEYALKLAWLFPIVDYDDDGEKIQFPHYTLQKNDSHVDKVIQALGISKVEFLKQETIIPVLEAYGLDIEKFWLAVVYVAHLTNMWAKQRGLFDDNLPTALNQLTRMRDEIKGRHEFEIRIDNPIESHTFQMAGDRLMKLLVGSLDELIEKERCSYMANVQELPTWRSDVLAKTTEMTWYSANLFKRLFEALNLPVIRSRNIKKVFKTIAKEEVLVKGKDALISYDKNQLIAELIHYLRLTDNPNLDGNSIKSILNSKRKFVLDIC